MKTVRAILFLVAMMALWTIVQALFFVLIGGGLAYALLFGLLFGYPMTALIGLFEYVSSKAFSGGGARLLFLLLAAGAYLAIWHFLTSPVPSRGFSNRDIVIYSAPGAIAVVIGYLMRGLERDRDAEQRLVA